jgi:putative ribosome biogenesis GTPase RsgA
MGKSQSKQTIYEEKDDKYAHFALVGSSGRGKSAFVNAVRGYVFVIQRNSATIPRQH